MSRRKVTVLALVVVVALVMAGALYRFAGEGGEGDGERDPAAMLTTNAEDMRQQAVDPSTFVTGLEGLPASLRDTGVDGALEVDASGRLRITSGIRHLFDYFLSAAGEESLDTILARIRAYIRHKLPAGPAAEAERILDAYLAYKQGLDGIQQSSSSPAGGQIDLQAVRYQMQQVRALRSQHFTPDIIAVFFADEDAYDQYTLARMELMQDKRLSPAARAGQLAALEQQLPSSMQESLKALNQYQNLQALTDDWRQRSGSPAELRQIRESLVGPEAADRLESLDRERSQWGQRMSAWLAERASILGNASLGQQDRPQQVIMARQQRFQPDEIMRVESLERMHDRGEKLP